MALQPSLNPLVVAGTRDAPHTLDVFLDYVCPYSAKLSRTVDTVLKPRFDKGGKYYGKVKLIVRLQVQPWHASSTFTHEAGLAVVRASPKHYWAFSRKLFDEQENFYDIPCSTLTPLQIREKLADIAESVIQDKGRVEEFRELLRLKGSPNGGVAVTDDLKYTIKFSRQNGVHVSPTALWDGVVASEISSSWGEEEWSKFLAEKVKV
ncbi:hypothetical protein L210DRAFT_3650100 [Boletus edulis BED1]|uniref:Thioredoxin-like fold domain-containing protein n=1 Tax=Boletus edulis BED1 TaxID=1328754 RepID=A0AAD4BKY8_BOLED|nr:hypothetical protein L210DRAFT_3650100 [Boletus edulis BED1]